MEKWFSTRFVWDWSQVACSLNKKSHCGLMPENQCCSMLVKTGWQYQEVMEYGTLKVQLVFMPCAGWKLNFDQGFEKGIWWILRDLHSLTLQLQKQRIASWFCASPDWTREYSFLLHRISHTNAAWWCDLGFESDSLLETITGVDICSQQDSMRFPLPLHLQDCFWENLIGWPRRRLVWVPIVKQYEISVKRRSVAKPCRTNTSLHPKESSSYPSGTSKVTGSFVFQSSLPSALDLAFRLNK